MREQEDHKDGGDFVPSCTGKDRRPTGGGRSAVCDGCAVEEKIGEEVGCRLNALLKWVKVLWGYFGGCFEVRESSYAVYLWVEISGEGENMSDFLIFGVLLLQILTALVGVWAFFTLSQNLRDSEDRLNALRDSPSIDLAPIVQSMTETMEDIVANTLENLEPPRAIDHVFGAVAQMIQARTMSIMNAVPVLGEAVEMVADNMQED